MKAVFKKGFTIYRDKNPDLIIVCPHSGPAFETIVSRDDNSETVGSLLFNLVGGKFIVSNISRKRMWGIDFNRDIPSLNLAIRMYEKFEDAKDVLSLYEFRKKYAWVSRNEQDYENKLKIYQSFWGEIEEGKNIVFLHRAFTRMKFFPSIMDFVSFKGKGVKKEVLNKVVKDLNSKYYNFLRRVERQYKQAILFEAERVVANILTVYKKFDLRLLEGEFKDFMIQDLKNVAKYSRRYVLKRLKENFTPQNYLNGIKSALEEAPMPELTVENTFDGSLALGPKRKLFPRKGRNIIEIEPSLFMNHWYPEVTARIIRDAMNKIEKLS